MYKVCWEEYQVRKRGRVYQGCLDECIVEKGKGEALFFPLILRLLGRKSNQMTCKFGEENQDLRYGGWLAILRSEVHGALFRHTIHYTTE